MAKSSKQSIREQFDKVKQMKELKNQLNATNFHTDSLPSQATKKNKFQVVKDNARQAMQDIRNGHADWHEPWWEHDLPSGFKENAKKHTKEKKNGK